MKPHIRRSRKIGLEMPPPKTHVSDRSYEHESDFKPEDVQVLQRKTELQHPQLRWHSTSRKSADCAVRSEVILFLLVESLESAKAQS